MALKRALLTLLIILGLTGCSNSNSNELEQKPAANIPESTPENTTTQTKTTEIQPTISHQITPNGGLGDSIEVFEDNYGINSSDDSMGRFQNDYILPMFLDGKAYNIKLQFEQTAQPRRTKEEAILAAKGMIPKDAVKVKEYIDPKDPGREIQLYTSKLLAKEFRPEMFGSAKPGTFIMILRKDEQGYFSVTLGLGNNP